MLGDIRIFGLAAALAQTDHMIMHMPRLGMVEDGDQRENQTRNSWFSTKVFVEAIIDLEDWQYLVATKG